MYEGFFHLSASPFSLLPDAEFLYPSKKHRHALTLLDYCVESHAGFAVITGEVGAGKTTIIRRFLRLAPDRLTVGVVTNTSAAMGNLLTWVGAAFGLPHAGLDNISLHKQFVDFLLERYAQGNHTLLIVDEAQNLSADKLEELRMLSNINHEKDVLLQIILVGQPELLETLRQRELRQFSQRITVHYHLEPLDMDDTKAYIHHRLSVVGGDPSIFEDAVCHAVHYFTGGVPRLINLLCETALVYAYAEEQPKVSVDDIIEVVKNRCAGGLSPFNALPAGMENAEIAQHLDRVMRDPSKNQTVEAAA